MPVPVHLDVSELVANPLRSGIQRIEREAIRYWPGPAPLQPCCVDGEGRLLRLPDAILDVLCAKDDGTAASRQTERDALARLATAGVPISNRAVELLLNLELYYTPVRAEAHLRLAAAGTRISWYLYDLLLPAYAPIRAQVS